jgi:arylsulfatase A-like enzyme
LSLRASAQPRIFRATRTRRHAPAWGSNLVALALLSVALVALSCGEAAPPSGPERSTPRGVVLVTVDTLRADHVGSYPPGDARTPHIDRLAREGTLFERALVPMPLTRPSHFSMFTSLYPREHGVLNNAMRLPASALTLAEILRERGFRTGAFVAVSLLGEDSGSEQGFEKLDSPRDAHEAPASEVVPRALDWVDGLGNDELFFLWVHLFDPHQPYDPPDEFRQGISAKLTSEMPSISWRELMRAALRKRGDVPRPLLEYAQLLYRREVEATDAWVGELVDGLAAATDLDELLIVFTADHGECFENGVFFEHADCLSENGVRVPLILRHPRLFAAGERVSHPVGVIDIAPTVLEAVSIEAPSGFSGRSLGHATQEDRYLLIQYPFYQPDIRWQKIRLRQIIRSVAGETAAPILIDAEKVGVVGRDWKYLRVDEMEELYSMSPSPRERENLADTRQEERDTMRGILTRELERHPLRIHEPSAVNPELLESLRALGYVE